MQRRWRVSVIVLSGVFMSSLDLFIVNIAFPAISHHFGDVSLGSLSWVLSGYAIVFAALLVPAGRWADAFGRKRAFLAGLAVFTIASAACAVAPTVAALVAARIVQAAGGALMLPTSLALILPEFEAEKRHVAIGMWAATGACAAAAGPPLGGLLVQANWRWVFLVNVPIGLAALAAGIRWLTERREQGEVPRPDMVAATSLMVAVGALVVAIVKGEEWGWFSPVVIALVVGGLLLLPVIWWRSEHHPAPIVEPELLKVPRFALAVTASLLFFAGFGAFLLTGVLFLTEVWHESVLTTGLMLFPGPAAATALSFPSARLGARFGYRLPGLLGVGLFSAGIASYLVRVGVTPHYFADFLPAQIVTGAGVGLVIPTLTGAGVSALAPDRFATGAAVLTMGRQIGIALGIALLVAVLGAAPHTLADFHGAWLLTIGFAVCAGAVLAAIGAPAAARRGAPRPAVADPA